MTTHRPRQPGASLAHRAPPRIIAFEPIPPQFTPRKPAPYRFDLAEIIPQAEVDEITAAGRLAFHCVGDTGGIKHPEPQNLVARGLEQSLSGGSLAASERSSMMFPSFFYHLGDVIYYNGVIAEYWPQFYEPYEHYPLPIVAIPGNHDGELLTLDSTTLDGFYLNFCAEKPGTFVLESRDSGRAAQTQPYVYHTLVTPFATIIGLYTNVPEHGQIDDAQRAWFRGEMAAADPHKALIVAFHHPIYSFDSYHSGSPTMALELQDAINESRRLPNMILGAHVHNYQRIEKTLGGHTIPFLVMGMGGYWNLHNINAAIGYTDPETQATLVAGIDSRHGFSTIELSPKVINVAITTVPRPQESWTDPNAYNQSFDVFSYSALPLHLKAGETVELVPGDGSNVPPATEVGKPPPHRTKRSAARVAAVDAHAARTHARHSRHKPIP